MIPGNQNATDHAPHIGEYGSGHTPTALQVPATGLGAGWRIGYSFWGFVGSGVTDTPDGGRFWRRPIIDALTDEGHQMILLQANRDATEAHQDLPYLWSSGLPDIDVLFAEWRWRLPGRNTTRCAAPGHTCDLHRQSDLIDHYARRGTPTLIWDTDRQLPSDDPIRTLANVIVCEPAIAATPGAHTLLHPVPDTALDAADPKALSLLDREWPLVYVGNQYDRDEEFTRYFLPATHRLQHRVAGKWASPREWRHVNFTGRLPFDQVQDVYAAGLATVLLLPARYNAVGHQTQRLFEAVLAGCLPLTPTPIPQAAAWTPPELHVADGKQVISKIKWAGRTVGTGDHADLIAGCLTRLNPFRLSLWTDRLHELIQIAIDGTRP